MQAVVPPPCPTPSQLLAALREGLAEGRWQFHRSIAPSLTAAFQLAHPLSHDEIERLFSKAEASGAWPKGWAKEQLSKACARTRARGEQSGVTSLTEADVKAIRRAWQRFPHPATLQRLQGRHHVSKKQLRRIIWRHSWAHVPSDAPPKPEEQ